MARGFLIAGTAARVGKTTVGCALGFAMRARGIRVGVMKPVDTVESQDAQSLALAVGSTMPVELMCPFRYREDSAPAEAFDLVHIAQCFDEIAAQSDVVLVESANAVDFAELAATLNLEVIVVVGNRAGCVDATTIAIRRCADRGLKIAGYILCDCDPVTEVDEASMRELVRGLYLGRMQHRQPLAKTIVEKLV
jgi:dethiobiotin synthetase